MANRSNRPLEDNLEQSAIVTLAATLGDLPFDVNPAPAPADTSGQSQEIVFIEGSVPDARQLAAGVTAGATAVILDPNGDGVWQIASYLTSHDISNLAAIDIVAHGSDGAIELGTATLSSATLADYQTQLATIGAALAKGGGIRIYGCDVAQDPAGVAFVDALSSATGGASVAAASHLVGAASGGGSWDLNVNTGVIDAGSPFTAAAETAYPAELGAAGTSELFLAFNINNSSDNASIERLAVSGSSPATGLTTLTNSGDLSKIQGVGGLVVEDPQGLYYVAQDDIAISGNGTTDQILVGAIGSSSLSAPSYLDFSSSPSISIWGIAESSNPNVLYFTNYDAADTALNGIWTVNVNTGATAPVAVSPSVLSPWNLAIDRQNNLAFFADTSTGTTSQLDVGNLSTGNVQTFDTTNIGQWLYGVAVNNGTVYFDAGNAGSVDAVYNATYTVSGGVVSLGPVRTLYSVPLNRSVTPTSLAVDPANGVFYIGDEDNNGATWNVWEGSLGGSAVQQNLIEVASVGGASGAGPDTDALTILSIPTITTGAVLSYSEVAAPVVLDSGLSVTNADGQDLASATVKILNGSTNDVLTTNTSGTAITATYTASTQTLTLSGVDTAADYQSVLSQVTFSSTGASGTRTIDWTASDGLLTSPTSTSTINVTHVPGTVTAGASVTYTGTPVVLDPGLTVSDPDSGGNLVAATITIAGYDAGDTLPFTNQNGISGSFNGGALSLTGTATIGNYQSALESVRFSTTSAVEGVRTIDWTVSDGAAMSNTSTSTANVICFCKGTLIGTPDGVAQVEKLRAGDQVLTDRNGPRTVKWVGHGKVLATRGTRSVATPVIVCKGALAENVPHHDLHVTKAHGIYLDSVLIPAEFLVNHRTILWDDRAQEVEIYHVELDSHDVLLANGAWAESYRDDGNRWLFQNGNPSWGSPAPEPYAPVVTGGPIVDAVWMRLLERAGPRSRPPMTDDPDLHLLVDGYRVDAAERDGANLVFRLSGKPNQVQIVSREVVPAELGIARDARSLGVGLRRIVVRQGSRFEVILPNDPRLIEGFNDFEPLGGLRWTDGHGTLPKDLFAPFTGEMEVVLVVAATTTYPDYGEVSGLVAA